MGLGEGEFFHRNDGVAVGGEDGTGHDLPAVGGFEFVGNGGAGGVKPLNREGP